MFSNTVDQFRSLLPCLVPMRPTASASAWFSLLTEGLWSFALFWNKGKSGLHQGLRPSGGARTAELLDVELLRTWQQKQTQRRAEVCGFSTCVQSPVMRTPIHTCSNGYNRDSEALEQNTIVLLTTYERFHPISFQNPAPAPMLDCRTVERNPVVSRCGRCKHSSCSNAGSSHYRGLNSCCNRTDPSFSGSYQTKDAR